MAQTFDASALSAAQQAWVAGNVKACIKAMRIAAERVRGMYVGRVDRAKLVDTGRLKSSFIVEPLANGALLANAAPYFDVMDQGRRAGGKLPPLEPILQWVLRKRLLKTRTGTGRTRASVNRSAKLLKEAKGLAFVIRRSIARKGIAPREITTRPNTASKIAAAINDAVNEAMRAVTP
jgi:hypothetical protein